MQTEPSWKFAPGGPYICNELVILPARVRKRRDKAAVEGGVLLVERWILARLGDVRFFPLATLSVLPASAYEYAIWRKAKVHLDYHVEVERRYYSAPHAVIGKTVDVRIRARSLEIFRRAIRPWSSSPTNVCCAMPNASARTRRR